MDAGMFWGITAGVLAISALLIPPIVKGAREEKILAKVKSAGPRLVFNQNKSVIAVCHYSQFMWERQMWIIGIKAASAENPANILKSPVLVVNPTFTFSRNEEGPFLACTGTEDQLKEILSDIINHITGHSTESFSKALQSEIRKILVVEDKRLFIPFHGPGPTNLTAADQIKLFSYQMEEARANLLTN